jgi:hypothetical protein
VVLEIYLYNFVAQSEHYRVLGPHPFLHIHWWLALQGGATGLW